MALSEQECRSDGKLKSTPTATVCSRSIGPESSVMETSENSKEMNSRKWNSSAEGSHVNPSANQENEGALPMRGGSGLNSSGSFARFDPDTSSWKMYPGCYQSTLGGSWAKFSETWPHAGIVRNGIAYLRSPSGLSIVGTGFLSFPTPTTADTFTYRMKSTQMRSGSRHSLTLARAVHIYPTMTATDAKGGKYQYSRGNHDKPYPTLSGVVGGMLNPKWIEWLMGFPPGWTETDSKPSGMPSSRKSRNTSEGSSSTMTEPIPPPHNQNP